MLRFNFEYFSIPDVACYPHRYPFLVTREREKAREIDMMKGLPKLLFVRLNLSQITFAPRMAFLASPHR